MLTKIIDLGFEVPETGEPRVRIADPALLKTAATEIQEFWDKMPEDPDSSYLWVIGVSAMEFYGCNNNGDAFHEDELKSSHNRFVESAHVFQQHVNKDPAKSIGRPVFSWYNDDMHRVELILKISKKIADAANIIAKIRRGEPIFVSMGCRVDHDVCSICGNEAKTRREYCDHLRYNMKKILPDGKQVFAINPDPHFFDISIVLKPADPTAFTLDKRASLGHCLEIASPSSAELGETADDLQIKIAALKKLSDMVKEVDGQVADGKEGFYGNLARNIDSIDYPEMPYQTLSGLNISPSGYLGCLAHLDAPLTLGDAAFMSGCHVFGRPPTPGETSGMFNALPLAISSLLEKPDMISGILRNIISSYNGELEDPVQRTVIIRVMRPVCEARISIVRRIAHPDELLKLGAAFGHPDHYGNQYGTNAFEQIANDFRSRKQNFAPIVLRDKYGNEVVTNPYYLRQAETLSSPLKIARNVILGALGLAAIGGVVTRPTLAGKALALCACGVPAALVVSCMSDNNKDIVTSEGGRISRHLADAVYKFEKKGSLKPRMGMIAGLSIPGALALDYAYNKWRV